jgi:hypothetical protein
MRLVWPHRIWLLLSSARDSACGLALAVRKCFYQWIDRLLSVIPIGLLRHRPGILTPVHE